VRQNRESTKGATPLENYQGRPTQEHQKKAERRKAAGRLVLEYTSSGASSRGF